MTGKEKLEKVRAEVKRLYNEEYGSAATALHKVLDYIDSLQEEPVSEDLEEASLRASIIRGQYIPKEHLDEYPYDAYAQSMFKRGANWREEHLWKPADGEDLPEINREVIALLGWGKVVFAHRPPEFWDGEDIVTGKVTRYFPKTYDKGGWNQPDVVLWLDYDINELLCREK